MVWSSDAVARHTLFGDHEISDKPFVCPFKLRISSPENGDHILAKLSAASRKRKKKKKRISKSVCVHTREAGRKREKKRKGTPSYRRRPATFRLG
jgi:hypothetical protein